MSKIIKGSGYRTIQEQKALEKKKKFHGSQHLNPINEKRLSSKGRVRKTNC